MGVHGWTTCAPSPRAGAASTRLANTSSVKIPTLVRLLFLYHFRFSCSNFIFKENTCSTVALVEFWASRSGLGGGNSRNKSAPSSVLDVSRSQQEPFRSSSFRTASVWGRVLLTACAYLRRLARQAPCAQALGRRSASSFSVPAMQSPFNSVSSVTLIYDHSHSSLRQRVEACLSRQPCLNAREGCGSQGAANRTPLRLATPPSKIQTKKLKIRSLSQT